MEIFLVAVGLMSSTWGDEKWCRNVVMTHNLDHRAPFIIFSFFSFFLFFHRGSDPNKHGRVKHEAHRDVFHEHVMLRYRSGGINFLDREKMVPRG